jgi:hypothetical protein
VPSGDKGGNGTALGIKGAAVPRFGKNDHTEQDTTVFGGNANNPKQDGLGKTASSGNLKVSDLADAMALAGNTLPQVSGDGTGFINGTWRIVTSDGTSNDNQGNMFAVIDPTGTGKYKSGIQITATSSMVGNHGNVVQRALQAIGITKRATNVGADAVSEMLPGRQSSKQRTDLYRRSSLSRSLPVSRVAEQILPADRVTSVS